MRNKLGLLLAGSTSNIFANSPLVEEALALREDITVAANLNLSDVALESDSLELIKACKGEKSRGEIVVIASDIEKNQRIVYLLCLPLNKS